MQSIHAFGAWGAPHSYHAFRSTKHNLCYISVLRHEPQVTRTGLAAREGFSLRWSSRRLNVWGHRDE